MHVSDQLALFGPHGINGVETDMLPPPNTRRRNNKIKLLEDKNVGMVVDVKEKFN